MLERNWRVENRDGEREEILLSQKAIHMETIERFTNSSSRLLVVIGFTTEIQFISPKFKTLTTRSYEGN